MRTNRNSDQFKVRLPDGMREEISKSADANNRSMSAEIVARIANSAPEKTLRDEIAIAALTGLYASRDLQMATLHDAGGVGQGNFEDVMAKQAYRQADAFLAAREVKHD